MAYIIMIVALQTIFYVCLINLALLIRLNYHSDLCNLFELVLQVLAGITETKLAFILHFKTI